MTVSIYYCIYSDLSCLTTSSMVEYPSMVLPLDLNVGTTDTSDVSLNDFTIKCFSNSESPPSASKRIHTPHPDDR